MRHALALALCLLAAVPARAALAPDAPLDDDPVEAAGADGSVLWRIRRDRAVVLGDRDAAFALGLSEGARGFRWYRLAAGQGHPGGANNVGVAYHDGKGVRRDPSRALRWFAVAAEAGLPLAMVNLGGAYEEGAGTRRDLAKAAAWYRKAAASGDAIGMTRLASLMEAGRGVPRDGAGARKLLARAAALGDHDAALRLFLMDDPFSRGVQPRFGVPDTALKRALSVPESAR